MVQWRDNLRISFPVRTSQWEQSRFDQKYAPRATQGWNNGNIRMFSIGKAGNKPSPSLKTTKRNWISIILTNVDFISGCAVSLSFCAMFARKRIPINIDQSTQKLFSAHVCLTTWRKDFLYSSRFPFHQRSALRDARWARFHRSKLKKHGKFSFKNGWNNLKKGQFKGVTWLRRNYILLTKKKIPLVSTTTSY